MWCGGVVFRRQQCFQLVRVAQDVSALAQAQPLQCGGDVVLGGVGGQSELAADQLVRLPGQ